MSINLGQVLGVGGEVLEVAVEAEETITLDAAEIKAGQPATSPGVAASVEGVEGKFTVTFTPNSYVAPAAAAPPA
jgi:hypothetical protein